MRNRRYRRRVTHFWTLFFYLILVDEIESRFLDGFIRPFNFAIAIEFYRILSPFLANGKPTEPVPIALRDLQPVTGSHAEQILARSGNERGRPREALEFQAYWI